MQTEQLLCWSGMTDTEHGTTSGSNEEDKYWSDSQSKMTRMAITNTSAYSLDERLSRHGHFVKV